MHKQSQRNRLLKFGEALYDARNGMEDASRIEKQFARQAVRRIVLAMCLIAAFEATAVAYTPTSPEVRQTIDKGVKFLESDAANDEHIGAKSLLGLALVKYECKPDHPKILQQVQAIQKALGSRDPSKLNQDDNFFNIYATGMTIIFLVELDPVKYRPDIDCLVKSLRMRQKRNGAWGYPGNEIGDTSMTQYGVLSSWEAAQAGFPVPIESMEAVMAWLMHTQDPSGGFGYQGTESKDNRPGDAERGAAQHVGGRPGKRLHLLHVAGNGRKGRKKATTCLRP